jgi:hypothetical protein
VVPVGSKSLRRAHGPAISFADLRAERLARKLPR